AARDAPRRPQIEEDGSAAPVGERLRLARGVAERQFRELASLLGDLDGRDLAVGERCHAPGKLERRPACGLAGVARHAYNAVYRREGAKPCDRRNQRQRRLAGPLPTLPGRWGRVGRGMFGTIRHDLSRLCANPDGPVMSNKMWGGRFDAEPDAIMAEINTSIDVDRKLFRHDIAASRAHAEMLKEQGIISAQDAQMILHGLDTILSEMEAGTFIFKRELEDIHMNVEARLAQ